MYSVKTPFFLRSFYKSFIWRLHAGQDKVYLTFDDGPHPEITPKVLDILQEHGAKATFFCLGENVKNNPDVYQRIIDEGHEVGNHTWSHTNGWKAGKIDYAKSVLKSARQINSRLFRPPYGKIKRSQATLIEKRFTVVMWDLLSGDFDLNCTPEQCFQNVERNVRDGSIVVFHDSDKAQERMLYALPRILGSEKLKKFTFEKLPHTGD